MNEWWNTLSTFQQIMWVVAVPATLIFLVQFLLIILGVGHHDHDVDVDADVDVDIDMDVEVDADLELDVAHVDANLHVEDVGHAGTNSNNANRNFRLITVRNLIVFFMIFGWTAFLCSLEGLNVVISLIAGFITGVAMMYILAWILYVMLTKLTHDGTMNLLNAIQAKGEVYLPIPANQEGIGKVHVSFQGALREMEAVTTGERLTRGTRIRVIDVLDNNLLLVDEDI